MNFDDFNAYQIEAYRTAVYLRAIAIPYCIMGLAGETGEVAETVKKLYRDDKGILTDERKAKLVKEMGDVCWYLAALCTEIGVDLGDVARANLDKLHSREERHVLHGDGDDR